MGKKSDRGLLVPSRALRRKRLWLLLASLLGVSLGVVLMLVGLRDNIVFFYSPSEVVRGEVVIGESGGSGGFRVGGLVLADSIEYREEGGIYFSVSDGVEALVVDYGGILPDLFREGQGVVVRGRLGADGIFVAEQVLAKHDENYLPAEAVQALKAGGVWRGE